MRQPTDELADLEQRGLLRSLKVLDSPQGASIELGGQTVVNFSSNDYLGLTQHPRLKAAFSEAIDNYGVGSGASRLISGTQQPHQRLEESIAAHKGHQAALTFSSGFATASGAIPALFGKDDYIILDKLCHACLVDGARASGATMRVFPHNDLGKLESHLQWATAKASADSRILVLTESVFSMDGDLAPLAEIVELKDSHDALLWVDEAHALGVLGPAGRGLAAELGVETRIDFLMGTFSKAAGLSGGYLCASRAWIDCLINRARSFIYSTAPSPALAHTITEAIDLIASPEGDQLRTNLRSHIDHLAPDSPTPIIPHIVGENEPTLALAADLLAAGYYVPAIRYPTVPRGSARLRITLSAAHSADNVQSLRGHLG